MSLLPEHLLYSESHEWVRDDGDGIVTVGLTDHAQTALGDVVYLELPEIDSDIEQGSEVALVESVKAASDIYAPVSGAVVSVNKALVDSPETLNESCYEDGWLFSLRISDPDELTKLMSAPTYLEMTEAE